MQLAVGAYAFGKFGQCDGFGRRVGTAARHDGHAPARLLNGCADDFAVFFNGDSRRFARGADYANAVGALFDVPVNQFAQAIVIDAAVCLKGRCQCNDAASYCLHDLCLATFIYKNRFEQVYKASL